MNLVIIFSAVVLSIILIRHTKKILKSGIKFNIPDEIDEHGFTCYDAPDTDSINKEIRDMTNRVIK